MAVAYVRFGEEILRCALVVLNGVPVVLSEAKDLFGKEILRGVPVVLSEAKDLFGKEIFRCAQDD